jgi:hypothetical protein
MVAWPIRLTSGYVVPGVDRGSVVADLRLKNVVGVVADPRDQSPKLHREIRAERRVTV